MKRSIILFGGGKESIYNLVKESEDWETYPPTVLLFNYGQKSFSAEAATLKHLEDRHSFTPKVVDLRGVLDIPESIKTGVNAGSDHVYARNIVFLSIAFNIALSYNSKRNTNVADPYTHIYLGATNKASGVDDSETRFVKEYQKMISKIKGYKLSLNSYSMHKTSYDILNWLLKHHPEDAKLVWFCENNTKKFCGKCTKCQAFLTEYKKGLYGTSKNMIDFVTTRFSI